MASNWIKVEVITPDKPEVYLIAEKLNIDPDMVVGKLIRLWVWADQQIAISNAECNASNVTDNEQEKRFCNPNVLTKIAIDRITFMPGFADALIHAGWLIQEEGGLYFKNFEKHNGKSSKNRALTNDRVTKSREKKRDNNAKSNAGRNGVSVTKSDRKQLPEEEEDIKDKDPPLSPPRGKSAGNKFDPLAVALPEFISPELWAEWVNFRRELKKPIKTARGVAESINRLREYRAQGFSPESVIRNSIANEYQGLFAPGAHSKRDTRDINALPETNNTIPAGFRG